MCYRLFTLARIRIAIIAMLLISGMVVVTSTKADDGKLERTQSAAVGTPVTLVPDWQAVPPMLSREQQLHLKQSLEQTNLPGPVETKGNVQPAGTSPTAESQVGSRIDEITPQLDPKPQIPSDPMIFRNKDFRSAISNARGSMDNIMEVSVGVGGKFTFHTGNWFAARSINGGSTFTYINPYAGMSDFCCDQTTIYDGSRDTLFWYRQGDRDSAGNNRFLLSVSNNGGGSFCTYSFASTDVNSGWRGNWFDYPHMQLGSDFLYISTNMFNNDSPDPHYVRTVMLRFPLDSLDSCVGFNYRYYDINTWSSFVPVQGADQVMWFASNWPSTAPQNNRLGIWRWDEDSDNLTFAEKTVAAWTFTNSNASCGTGSNWLSRASQKLLAGARYTIQNTNVKYPGRKVLGWWWNVAQGSGFSQAYIEGAAFFENDLTQVPGNQGRPLIFNATTCFAYPSVAANSRGDIAMVLNEGSSTSNGPSLVYGIADDYTEAPAPWALTRVQTSSSSANAWGDYNTVRAFEPSLRTWVGGGHYINSSNRPAPVYFAFGRARDYQSWNRWKGK